MFAPDCFRVFHCNLRLIYSKQKKYSTPPRSPSPASFSSCSRSAMSLRTYAHMPYLNLHPNRRQVAPLPRPLALTHPPAAHRPTRITTPSSPDLLCDGEFASQHSEGESHGPIYMHMVMFFLASCVFGNCAVTLYYDFFKKRKVKTICLLTPSYTGPPLYVNRHPANVDTTVDQFEVDYCKSLTTPKSVTCHSARHSHLHAHSTQSARTIPANSGYL